MATKKGQRKLIFPSFLLLDPGKTRSGIRDGKNPGSGKIISDPQHWK
jgi:hypothetical protein